MQSWEIWPPKCESCGRFTNHGMTYIYFASGNELEPPEPKHVCQKCWDKNDMVHDEILKRICWSGPIPFDYRMDGEKNEFVN